MSTETESEFVSWARDELKRAGLFDKDSDYEGMVGEAVMGLVQQFSGQGHSGLSAFTVAEIFHQLAQYKPLGPITDDPDEWANVSEYSEYQLWQSRRMPSAFSKDRGKTYWNVDEPESWWRNLIGRLRGKRVLKMHRSKESK